MKHVNPDPMPLSRLAELLDAYGGDPERWPQHERALAVSLVQSDPRAAELQRAALQLDQQLEQFEVSEPSAQLQARVLEIPIRQERARRARFALPGWGIAALALVPCALGFLSGALSTETSDPDEGWSEVASMTQLGDVSEEQWP
jgi:hypothetical protein